MEQINQTMLQEKWAPVLDSQEAGKIGDAHRRKLLLSFLRTKKKHLQKREDNNISLKQLQPMPLLQVVVVIWQIGILS